MPGLNPPQPLAATDQRSGDYVLKGGWYTLWLIVFLVLVANTDARMLILSGPAISLSLGLTDAELGVILGLATALFAVVAVYPIAWAADRYDRRLVFALCLILWSAGTAACGFAQNFEHLFIAAVAIAAGEAVLTPIGIAFVPDLFKGRKRLTANGIFFAFAALAAASGLMVAGGAISLVEYLHSDLPATLRAFEPWRLAFFLVVIPTPIFLVLLIFSKLGRPKPATDAAQAVQAPPPRHDFWRFVTQHRRAVLWLFGGMGSYGLGMAGFQVWLPIAATRMFATTPGQNGTLMGAASAVGLISGVAIGTFIVRRMVVRWGSMASIRFYWMTMLAGVPIFLAFPFVTAAWQLFGLFGLLMMAYASAGCAIPTIMQDMAPADLRGRMAAIWSIVGGLLAGLSPTVIGWMSGALGSAPRMLVVAICIIAIPSWIIAALCFRMAERPFGDLARHVADEDAMTATPAH